MTFYYQGQGNNDLQAVSDQRKLAFDGASSPLIPRKQQTASSDFPKQRANVAKLQIVSHQQPSSQTAHLAAGHTPMEPPSTELRNPSLSTSPAIYFRLDADGVVLAVNPEGAAYLGYTAEALIGEQITDLFYQPDHALLHATLLLPGSHALMRQGKLRLVCQDGRVLSQTVVVQTLQTAGMFELLLICNSSQTLALHEPDSAVKQTELYQKVQRLDKIQRLNADLERQIQARTAELQLAFDFEATLKRITDKVRDSLDEHQILETVVQEVACAIGVSCCNASIYDLEAGTSTIFYEYTTSLSPYQGRVVQLDAFPELYGQLLDGQAFQFCSLVVNPERGRVSMLTCAIVDDQGVLGDLWLINHPYYCFSEQDIRLVQQVANQCAIGIRQARLYQAAQAQVTELERLNRLKDDFLSTVSHELRTPMTNIKMATQMLEVILKQGGMLDEEKRLGKYVQILQGECQREISLIDDLLDLSRLDTEPTPLQLAAIELDNWLPTAVRPFQERAHSQQQQLTLEIMSPLPAVMTELSSLERILAELLQNACKYTPSGETIMVSASLEQLLPSSDSETTIFPDQEVPQLPYLRSVGRSSAIGSHLISDAPAPLFLLFRVTNTGVVIPPQELSRVFEKFYRIPNHDPWQHGGTGLGLALVKKLVERLGGEIWGDSEVNQTTFTLKLPIAV